MQNDIERVLINRGAIADRVRALADEITQDLCGSAASLPAPSPEQDAPQPARITLVPILTGSLIFVSDLIRHLPIQMQIHPVSISSYPGTATTSQGPKVCGDIDTLPDSLEGADVLVIDDILDSGNTLSLVTQLLEQRQPRSVRTCVMLRKQRLQAMSYPIDYVGFDIPDEFVVGYGLDYNGYYRNLPDIVTLRPEILGLKTAT